MDKTRFHIVEFLDHEKQFSSNVYWAAEKEG